MNIKNEPNGNFVLHTVPRTSSALMIMAGSLVGIGWIFDIASLKSISPNWVTMKLNTAACFILSGASLWCLSDERATQRVHLAGRIFAAVVALVALLTLGEHLLGTDFLINQILMKQPPSPMGPASPGRMSAATSFSFLLIALALLGLDSKNRHGHRPALAFALVTATIGLLGLAGYVYGAKSLYEFSSISSMDVYSTALFIAASLGVLCARPDEGPLGILTAEGTGSAMARRILPLAIVLSIVIGWLHLQGERTGLYGFEFGLALFATLNVVVFTILIWLTAVSLNVADAERKRAVAAVSESELSFRRLAEQSPDAMVMHQEGNIVFVNDALVSLMRAGTAADLVGKRATSLIHSGRVAEVEQRIRSLYAGQKVPLHEQEYVRLDGTLVDVEVASSSFILAGKPAALVTIRDITERKQATTASALLSAIVESSDDGIASKDLNGIITSWNAGAERIFGYAMNDIVGKSILQLIPPDRHMEEEEILTCIRRGERMAHFETVRIGKSGRSIEVSITVSPIKDKSGRIVGASKIVRDITERKQVEEEIRRLNANLEARVAQRTAELRDKNKELETFSYSVSHDLKAPLRGIDGYSRLLLTEYDDKLDEDGRRFLENIRSATSQMQQLIDDLLAYSKLERRSLVASRVDPCHIVKTILDERRLDLQRVQISVDVTAQAVCADPEGMSLVLRNLIDNAVKFSKLRQPPVIEIRSRVENDRHIISVHDNGTGFDMKYHDRIFQIFQRLHRSEEFDGTGVGLAIVHKAMERMGGRVWAQSAPDKGAIFYIDLPCAETAGPSDAGNTFT